MVSDHLVKKVATNAFFKATGELAIRVLSFAFIVFVARVLGDSQFGMISFAYSFALLFVVIVDFGLNPLIVRDTARDLNQTASLFFNLLIIKMILGLCFLLAVVIGLWMIKPDPQVIQISYWLALFVMLNSFTEFICSVFHGHQKMQLEAAAMISQKIMLLLAGIMAISIGFGVLGVAMAYTAAGVVGLSVAVILLKKGQLLTQPWKFDRRILHYAFKQALPLTLTTLFINLYFRIDITLLTKLTDTTQVGWYSAAHKCIEVLMVIPTVLVVATFPGFSKLYHDNKEQLQRAAVKVLRLLLMLGLPIAVGSLLVGVPLMTMIFGKAFELSGHALGFLAIALCFIFLNYALSYILIAAEKQKVNAIVAGLAVLVSILCNLWLIPKEGYMGAALAAVITELFLFAAYYVMVNRLIFKLHWHKEVMKIVSAATVMGGVVFFFKNHTPLTSIPLGAVSYGIALWLFKAIGQEDIALIKRAVRK